MDLDMIKEPSYKFKVFSSIIFSIAIIGNIISMKCIVKHYSEHDIVSDTKGALADKQCKDIFEIRSYSSKMSKITSRIAQVLGEYKDFKRFIPYMFYEILSYESPSMFKQVPKGHGINSSHISIKDTWRLQQVNGQLPYMSCPLQLYDSSKMKKCAAARLDKNHKTHLAFVGDSRIRQILEVNMDLARKLGLSITTHTGQIIPIEDFQGQNVTKQWKKYKHKFHVSSAQAPSLKFDFYWAAYIDKGDNDTNQEHIGALELLKLWNLMPDNELPDMIIMNTGVWQLYTTEATHIYQIDKSGISVMQRISYLLSKLSERTTVIWNLPDPYKEYIGHDFSENARYTQEINSIMEWMLNAQIILVPHQVIKWDSFIPISLASRLDCMRFISFDFNTLSLPQYSQFISDVSWHCHERVHNGFESLSVAVQMIWNHLCNPYLPGEYCCSK